VCGRREIHTILLVENLVEIGHWEFLGLGVIFIQKCIFYKRWVEGHGLGSCGSR